MIELHSYLRNEAGTLPERCPHLIPPVTGKMFYAPDDDPGSRTERNQNERELQTVS